MGTGLELAAPELIAGAEAIGGEFAVANTFPGALLPAAGIAPEAAVSAAAAAAAASGSGATGATGTGLGTTIKSALPYINAGTGLASLAVTLGADRPTGASAPALTDPTAMPEPFATNKDVNAARRASIAEQMRRRGRASTILTDQSSDKLGD